MELLDDYKEPQREHLEGFVPYVSLRNEEIADVMAVLEDNKVEFKLKKIMGSTNNTFLLPLSATQLSQNSTLIYIKEQDKTLVDEVLDQYFEGAGQKYVEERVKKQEEAKEQRQAENKQKKWTFFNLTVLFLLIVLIWSFVEFYYY